MRGVTAHGALAAELVAVLEGRTAGGTVPQLLADGLTERELAILRYLLLCGYNKPDLEDLIDRMRTAESIMSLQPSGKRTSTSASRRRTRQASSATCASGWRHNSR